MPRNALPAVASALFVLVGGVALLAVDATGPLSGQMALHIALMNVAAPMLAAAVVPAALGSDGSARPAWTIAVVQMALLWAWHAPSVQRAAVGSHSLHIAMHTSLFVVAFCFWRALLRLPALARWHAIPVLLLTGKLACLLAALLIFSPRLLYGLPHAADGPAVTLADQQLAGLLMITACPLSYVVAGVIFAAQALSRMARAPDRRPSALSG